MFSITVFILHNKAEEDKENDTKIIKISLKIRKL